MREIWIPGLPATFATKGEGAWKNDIELAMIELNHYNCDAHGVSCEFILPDGTSSTRYWKDLENLCEPVFSVIMVLGGSKNNPENWRIDTLQVEKKVLGVNDGTVEVRIWRKRNCDIT